MKIEIDIQDELYKKFMDDWTGMHEILQAVRHGTAIKMDYSKELVNYHNEVIDTIDSIMRKTDSKITYEELKALRRFLGAYFEVHYLCKFMKGDLNEQR